MQSIMMTRLVLFISGLFLAAPVWNQIPLLNKGSSELELPGNQFGRLAERTAGNFRILN